MISLSHDFEPGGWGLYRVSWVELGVTAGSFAWFFMFFLLFIKILPALSISEIKEILPAPTREAKAR